MAILRTILVSFCLYIFYNIDFQTEGAMSTLSLAKARRTEAARPLTSYKTEIDGRSRSDSISSSSGGSIPEIRSSDSHPIPSTSAGMQFSETNMQEIDLQPLVKNVKKVGSAQANLPNLQEAASGTHVADINPTRDGFYSRVRSAFLQFSSAVVVGSAVGAGGAVIGEHLLHNISFTNSTTFFANETKLNANETTNTLFHDVDELNVIV